MGYTIPQVNQLYEIYLAVFETQLGQESPINDKAFLRVLAAIEAGQDIGIYKLAADRAKQNLALTATDDGLDDIGNNFNTPRKQATSAILESELPAVTGTVIPSTIDFISDANGLRYRATEPATAVAGVATLNLKCTESGANGSLEVGDTFQIASQVPGAETIATVISVVQAGINKEFDADYRPRVLFIQRAITGGANATDHKIWAEAVEGVKQALAYSGRPESEGVSFPGDRTVYIEATTDIDADGIAPGWLLDNVRSEINVDPDTGKTRAPLGITDETLFISSITRTQIFTEIRGLVVDADSEAACKADISTALTLYFATIKPFVTGVDLSQERTDTITSVTIGGIVQDVLRSYGASSDGIGFGLSAGTFLSTYVLSNGNLVKSSGVTYA